MVTYRLNPMSKIFTLATCLIVQSALADDTGIPGQIEELQALVGELNGRVQVLESGVPNSSVEGRTYCFILDLTVMRGVAADDTEELWNSIIRRTATFSGGSFSAVLQSHVRNTQLDDGTVALTEEVSPDPIMATYTQSGNKLDMLFSNGSSANWYVSKDGSVIYGVAITAVGPIGPNELTVGFTRNWTLVENDTCGLEGQ